MLYKQIQRVNGLVVLLKVVRKDPRNYTNDFGIAVHVYVPESQDTYKFIIEEPELRKFVCMALKVDAVNVQTLLDKKNIQKVVSSRLMCKKAERAGVRSKVMFSRQVY